MNPWVLVLLLLSIPFAARPFITDDIGTISPGQFQVETGLEYQQDHQAPVLALKHGVTPYMDLGLGLSSTKLPWQADCIQGHVLMIKFALWPKYLSLSTATELQSGLTQWNGIYSLNLGLMELHINGALEVDTSQTQWDYGLLLRKSWHKMALGVEAYGCEGEKPKLQLGLQSMPSDWVNMDMGSVYDLESRQWQINMGLSFNWKLENTDAP